MAYIGLPPKANFTSGLLDRFTSTTGTTVTLTHDISSENDIVVFVNFVKQDSTTYSVGGTGNKTLTLGGTLVSSDIVEVHYLNIVGQTVNPSANSVGSSQISADVITGQTALAVAPASTDELLISDAGTLKRVDVSLVGGNNKPSFSVSKSGNQTVSDNTYTLVTFDTESYDSNSAFSSNVFTVPSGEAGKYFFFGSARPNTSTDFSYFILYLYKNSTRMVSNWERNLDYDTLTISGILDLAEGDTVSLYVRHNLGSNLSVGATDNGITSSFGGFKLIGV